MNAAKRITGLGFAGLGLLLGLLCIGRAIETALDKTTQDDKRQTVTIGLLLGLPCTAGSLWMLGALQRQQRLMHSKQLQTVFYQALKANDGKINPLQLATLGQISVDDAQDCLEVWAQQLNADLKIDEAGIVVYCFNLSALVPSDVADA